MYGSHSGGSKFEPDPVIWFPGWVFWELSLRSPAECPIPPNAIHIQPMECTLRSWNSYVTYQRMSDDGGWNCWMVYSGRSADCNTYWPFTRHVVRRLACLSDFRSADNWPTAHILVLPFLTQSWKYKQCLLVSVIWYCKRAWLIHGLFNDAAQGM
jgi:hypothetical protein